MKRVKLGLCEVNSCMRRAVKEFGYNDQKLGVCAHHSVASFWSSEDEIILDGKTIEQADRRLFEQVGGSKNTARNDNGAKQRKAKSD